MLHFYYLILYYSIKGETTKKDEEENYLDLFSHKNMKLKERVLIPVKQYPKVRPPKTPKFWRFSPFLWDTEYYDYGHGEAQETYEAYGQDDWNGTRPSLKAPPARPVKGGYREHPYGRY
uniref:Sam68 tyrosine-rich domain-containing protein n=1 Tax=Serinus canaria TaxID=9135 RepID=A0A8C9MPD0_SERCA